MSILKIKRSIISVVFAFFVLCNSAIGQRNVVWVHSLDEDASFWATQANQPTLNDRNHILNSYSSNLTAAGLQLLSVPNNSRNIGIAHGLGGLLMREIDHTSNDRFGGMIMLGTPLNGFSLANSLQNGQAENFIDYHNEAVNKGPDAARNYDGNVVLNLYLFQLKPFWAVMKQMFFEWAAGADAVNVTENDIIVLDNGLIDQLQAVTSQGRNYSNSDPKILVYGEEDSRVQIKLKGSQTSNGLNDTDAEGDYQTGIDYYRSQAATWEPGWLCLFRCGERRSIAEQFREGESYLKTHMEWRWHGLIGAQGTSTRTYTYRKNICNTNYLGYMRMPLPNDESCYVTTTGTYNITLLLPNDGLVAQASATGKNSTWASQNTEIARLDGVNHFEMGEHFETRELLESILVDQNSDYNGFFKGKD